MNRLLGMGGYDISIHALREEGDQRHQPCHHAGGISIHALREEGDSPHFFVLVARRVFLSTPSARRATITCSPPSWKAVYFYPRPPRGGRRGDKLHPGIKLVFLSTPSARRATLRTVCRCHQADISIHALREEGDSSPESSLSRIFDFYPRPPRGGRPIFS